jgi:hypothetical protein
MSYERAQEQQSLKRQGSTVFEGSRSITYRERERNELKRWAITLLRGIPFNYDAVYSYAGEQELDPAAAESQAPVVTFFEAAFEWENMNYFLYPYFWGRRDSWSMRHELGGVEPQHLNFLRAGAARVVVPVTPGWEERMLRYLEADPTLSDNERLRDVSDGGATVPDNSLYQELWLELLTNKREGLTVGSGTLTVRNGDAEIQINDDSTWQAAERDRGRELIIEGDQYFVVELLGDGALRIDRPFVGQSSSTARYAAGSVAFGVPWMVAIPTNLVVLRENRLALNA